MDGNERGNHPATHGTEIAHHSVQASERALCELCLPGLRLGMN